MIGKTLGKYQITEHLGTGGMAEVYKAYQPGLERFVAVKVLHAFLAQEENFLARFQREAKVVAMLRHPNIIQVHDFDLDKQGRVYYMVMEFIDGPSLKMLLEQLSARGELMPLADTVRIVTGVAYALDYAHQRGMVHRDVKPANIVFNQDGQVILTDFGIAKMVRTEGLTASGAMVGTPAYIAPEQGLGEAGDERADIYSLGAVMYQMVTGQLPFDADTFMGIVMKQINEPLKPPSTVNPDLPPAIEAVIVRAMAKRPEDRQQTAGELAHALAQAVDSAESSAVTAIAEAPSEAFVQAFAEAPAKPRFQPRPAEPHVLAKPPAASVSLDTPDFPAKAPVTQRRGPSVLTAVLGVALALVLISIAALLATGMWGRLSGGLAAALAPPTDVPPTIDLDLAGLSEEAVATQIAAVFATYVATTGVTPTPSDTPTKTPTATPTATSTPDATATAFAACTFDALVSKDWPIEPSTLEPGQLFVKRWQITAAGTCTWPDDVAFDNASSDGLEVVGWPEIEPLAPDQTHEIAVTFRAPASPATYTSVWQLQQGGTPFGEALTVSLDIIPTPSPFPTFTPKPVATSAFTPSATATAPLEPTQVSTPTEELHFSVPIIMDCRKIENGRWWARVALTAWGGVGDYHYYQNVVSPETEFFNGVYEFEWMQDQPWFGTVIVTSGDEEARWVGALEPLSQCR